MGMCLLLLNYNLLVHLVLGCAAYLCQAMTVQVRQHAGALSVHLVYSRNIPGVSQWETPGDETVASHMGTPQTGVFISTVSNSQH